MADQNPNEQEQKHLYVVPNMGGNKSVNTSITGPESNTGGGIEVKVSPQHTGAPDATHGSRTRQGGDWSFGFNSGTGGGFNGGLSGGFGGSSSKRAKKRARARAQARSEAQASAQRQAEEHAAHLARVDAEAHAQAMA